MVLCVQHYVLYAAAVEHFGYDFRLFNRYCTYQYGLAGLMYIHYFVAQGVVFGRDRLKQQIVFVHAYHGPVGGYLNHVQIVYAAELVLLGLGRTGHARELGIHAEVVLEGNRGQRAVFARDLNAFLGLDSLMQTVGIAAAGHEAAGELIDDNDLALAHYIVNVALHHGVGL